MYKLNKLKDRIQMLREKNGAYLVAITIPDGAGCSLSYSIYKTGEQIENDEQTFDTTESAKQFCNAICGKHSIDVDNSVIINVSGCGESG
jgi:hypothetical protein